MIVNFKCLFLLLSLCVITTSLLLLEETRGKINMRMSSLLSTGLTNHSLPTSESYPVSTVRDFTTLEAKHQKGDTDAASVSKCRLSRKSSLILKCISP